jgi:hypothetical protein
MASDYDLSIRGAPLLHKEVLDIPVNSRIRLKVKDRGYTYFGIVRENPAKTSQPDSIVLHMVKGKNLEDPNSTTYDFPILTFNHRDIAECKFCFIGLN